MYLVVFVCYYYFCCCCCWYLFFKVTSEGKWGVKKPGELVHIINAIEKLFYILSNEHSCKGEKYEFYLKVCNCFLVLFVDIHSLQENS